MKKIVSVLLCLVMMMSLCTAAFADVATDHDCWETGKNYISYKDLGTGKHQIYCTVCPATYGEYEHIYQYADADAQNHVGEETGTYCICGAKKPAATVIVKYNVDGGVTVKDDVVAVEKIGTGLRITFTTPTTTKVGYTLAGWMKGTADEYKVGEEVKLNVYEATKEVTLTAKWVKCDHMGNNWDYKPVDDTHHSVTCHDCGFVDTESTVCVFETGECVCGNKCPHATLTYKDNDDGTHTGSCKECKKVIATSTMKHEFVNGKCVCGAVEPVEEYTVTYRRDDAKLVHATSLPATTKYAANTIVTIEGLVGNYAVSEGYTFAYWTDGTNIYMVGDTVRITGNLELTAVVVKQTAECDHMGNHWDYKSIDDTHHSVTCHDCGTVVTESTECVFKGDLGPCKCVCGNACKHTSYIYKVSEDGKTHEGYCAACGKHIATEDGEHELTYVNNKNGKNGTHNATCDKCGALVVDHEKHTFKGNKCTLCGAKKSASSGGSTTGTTTATTKSPKTGDMGVVLYAATALLSLSGTAVVIKKRKNDK